MTYKTMLVVVGSADAGEATLETAYQVAQKFGTHIEALHVRTDARGLVPYTGEGMDGSMIEEIMEVTEREGGERAQTTRAAFDAFVDRHDLLVTAAPGSHNTATASWREEVGREDEIVAQFGRFYDLIVVGRPVRDAPLPSPITVEAALLDTGQPTLVAPPVAPSHCGTKIAVAWEWSVEFARAMSLSLPMLEAAEKVWLMIHKEAAPSEIRPQTLIDRLAWHGVAAEPHPIECELRDLGACFLRESAALGADLLVKGAYSQGRLRQLILGGRTRHILNHAEIPVLFAY